MSLSKKNGSTTKEIRYLTGMGVANKIGQQIEPFGSKKGEERTNQPSFNSETGGGGLKKSQRRPIKAKGKKKSCNQERTALIKTLVQSAGNRDRRGGDFDLFSKKRREYVVDPAQKIT